MCIRLSRASRNPLSYQLRDLERMSCVENGSGSVDRDILRMIIICFEFGHIRHTQRGSDTVRRATIILMSLSDIIISRTKLSHGVLNKMTYLLCGYIYF